MTFGQTDSNDAGRAEEEKRYAMLYFLHTSLEPVGHQVSNKPDTSEMLVQYI